MPFTRVNWATHIDLKTGRPVLTELYDQLTRGEEVSIYPQRGVNAVPVAYNPNTGLIYTSSWDTAADHQDRAARRQAAGHRRRDPPASRRGDTSSSRARSSATTSRWTRSAARRNGRSRSRSASSAGMLATDGGLIFTGTVEGKFIALDEDTGKTLWEFQTGSGDQRHRRSRTPTRAGST